GDMTPQQPPQFDFSSGDKLDSPERKHSGDAKHKSRGILITAGIVLAVVGVLGGGFVVYYANQGNVNFSWFSRFGIGGKAPGSSDTAQVIAAEELGLKVSGEGAADKNRSASLLSDNINAELDSLRSLYQQQLRANPGLMGSITLQLTVVQTGQVTKVEELASQIKDEGFRKSVAEEVRAWRFAETTLGVVKVDCPLLFIPPGIDVTSIVKWERSIGPRATEPAMLAQADPPNRDSGATPQSPSSTTESTPTKPPPAPPAKPPSLIFYQTLRLTTVYREPREDSQQVASIPEGIKVNVVAVRGEWLEVRSKVGNPPGFIRKDSAVPSGNR
ncbi:MAG: AgmX/PglI C-terminal domain-containing protein, partial [Candidatus Binatia bacterium]|nr:AgmX/PglI C-terminal domain-containing protein [Candidatus Binatia bacterium]